MKLISLDQLELGMYVGRMEGAWVEHPFWRTRFLIRTTEELASLRAAEIERIWIDTSKGKDIVAAPRAPVTTPETAASPAVLSEEPHVETAEEEAERVCAHAKAAMTSIFAEARMAGTIDVKVATALVSDISGALANHPSALLSIARLKTADDYTYMHSVAVCGLMVAFCRCLGFDEERVRAGGMAGLMHDVGKAKVVPAVLNKPGALDDDEWVQMRRHPESGHRMLRTRIGVHADVLDACLHHHEKFDGTGYPHRMKGVDIPMLTRMVTLCDVYDAVTSDRPYKAGWDPADALHRMAGWKGHFDPQLFNAFVRTVGVYPIGALVRLASNRLAVVTRRALVGRVSSVKPTVQVVFSITDEQYVNHLELDLGAEGCDDRVIAREDRANWANLDASRLVLRSR